MYLTRFVEQPCHAHHKQHYPDYAKLRKLGIKRVADEGIKIRRKPVNFIQIVLIIQVGIVKSRAGGLAGISA